ncbi:hypothetical protein J5N97_000612 [Dioscorea zingiberensis]|uniref:COPA/B second beta-propeller domain-containing protein n=1 Tax=Dioscorea zingiberensis TaxID=325984 RepID=A0A9D5BS60_9LILI|nr:hypothetical protein J5N97_000612 [Dioscorea zingiberensis]
MVRFLQVYTLEVFAFGTINRRPWLTLFEVTDLLSTISKIYILAKQWIVAGSDDMFIEVYNYNTMDKVKVFEAHTDYIRVVIGYDEGTVLIKLGREVPVASMDSSGKIIWAKHNEIQTVNIKTVGADFEEKKSIRPTFSAERIFGGTLLAMCSNEFICFYDWVECRLIRRIDVNVKNLYWADSGDLLAIASDTSFYILKYNRDVVSSYIESGNSEDEFKVTTMFHLDRPMYLLGYLASQSRVYLIDKEFNVMGYTLLLSLIEYKTLVMRGDLDRASEVLLTIPKEHHNRQLLLRYKVNLDGSNWESLPCQLESWRWLKSALSQAMDLSGLLLLYSALGDAEGISKLSTFS